MIHITTFTGYSEEDCIDKINRELSEDQVINIIPCRPKEMEGWDEYDRWTEYSLKKLKKIGQGKIDDDVLEWIDEDLDYICDNSTVRFFMDYRWKFKNKQTGQRVDVYVTHYPDTDTIKFVDGQDSVYYINNITYSVYNKDDNAKV